MVGMERTIRAYLEQPGPRPSPPAALAKLSSGTRILDVIALGLWGGIVAMAAVEDGGAPMIIGAGVGALILAVPFWLIGRGIRRRNDRLIREGRFDPASILSSRVVQGKHGQVRQLDLAIDEGVKLRHVNIALSERWLKERGIDDSSELWVLSRPGHPMALLIVGEEFFVARAA